jgi:hypothetical protein
MPVQATAITIEGRVIQGLSYRMASYAAPAASVPASPYPFITGTYHVQTALGWVDIPASEVSTITVNPLAH